MRKRSISRKRRTNESKGGNTRKYFSPVSKVNCRKMRRKTSNCEKGPACQEKGAKSSSGSHILYCPRSLAPSAPSACEANIGSSFPHCVMHAHPSRPCPLGMLYFHCDTAHLYARRSGRTALQKNPNIGERIDKQK